MYTQSDWDEANALLRKRWWMVGIPTALLLAGVIASYVAFHGARDESGWIWTGLLTIACGGFFLFFHGVAIRPVAQYRRHIGLMLNGRMRENTGVLTEVGTEPKQKDGVDCIAIVVNEGDRADPEEDRLFYFDMLKGAPAMPVGTRVTVRSNDRMVSDIRPA